MLETYSFSLKMPHTGFDKIGLNLSTLVNSIISGSPRMLRDMVFKNYGIATFSDSDGLCRDLTITETDTFNRNKVNVLVYYLPETIRNDGYYDRMFIHRYVTKNTQQWNVTFYDTKTGRFSEQNYIDDDITELCRMINSTFNRISNHKMYEDQLKFDRSMTVNKIDL